MQKKKGNPDPGPPGESQLPAAANSVPDGRETTLPLADGRKTMPAKCLVDNYTFKALIKFR